ncbi:hypothetical protein DPEC_G00089180 [Dallia pectoralis]|uniref:Uncharacterized protein n=1 Tax=Dallia pectoralis TaxID=75939 RepID=A0ACC2H0L9_DALPE|nr:hypothetical protein DPEC_G00089180 [Dallia pectoralis]
MATPLSSSFGDSTSSDQSTSSEDTPSSCKQDDFTCSELCSICKAKLERNPHREVRFNTLYSLGRMLGQGGYGVVAIKFIPRSESEVYLTEHGTVYKHSLEVVLMHLVSQPPVCENEVELLDWYELPHTSYTLHGPV